MRFRLRLYEVPGKKGSMVERVKVNERKWDG